MRVQVMVQSIGVDPRGRRTADGGELESVATLRCLPAPVEGEPSAVAAGEIVIQAFGDASDELLKLAAGNRLELTISAVE